LISTKLLAKEIQFAFDTASPDIINGGIELLFENKTLFTEVTMNEEKNP